MRVTREARFARGHGHGLHRRGRLRRERGSGLLPTVFGVAILLGMVGLSVNVALGLWSRTTTESIAYEAARSVATARGDTDPTLMQAQAIERACSQIGPRCGEVELDFEHTMGDQMVALRVRAPGVGLLPRFIADAGPVVGDLDRTIRIRRESS